MANSNENDTMSVSAEQKKKIGAAVTLGALAAGAAAAGYYFYGHKDAEKHRREAAAWSRSFKKEVMRQMESAKAVNKDTVAAAVDKAVGIYERLRAIDTAELLHAARELKTHWQHLAEDFQLESKHARTSVSRSVKKAAAPAKRSRSTKAKKK